MSSGKPYYRTFHSVRMQIAWLFEVLGPIAAFYSLFLVIPLFRGQQEYFGVGILQATTDAVVAVVEMAIDKPTSKIFTSPEPTPSITFILHAGVWHWIGISMAICASALIFATFRLARRALIVGPSALLRDIRRVGLSAAISS
ncbi:hypothetical protein BLA39750_01182 [Burkholderia lata]|uniref:Uncharacterized protein n=1 Tax=Burkholderia lata (strain ATCC 17760 / DSM 23089 / LMG 22485 / NCIMB 9086 / R18194 / 383) TaxID=482957 RepID=A0A6P2VE03_BURL3|nr:hypothetical protein [Burkholderia lata]VWC80793.1 hypothetical protein BLA39750_01182 [Burkholderia lata]